MEPRIQYTKTADGVSIAYWTLGEGDPLLLMPPLVFSHTRLELTYPGLARWYQRLADHRRIIRFDPRGFGLSEQNDTDFSAKAYELDLDAIADRLTLRRFALMAFGSPAPIAIAYAAHNPERISHLILWCASVRGSDWARSPEVRSLDALSGKDWRLYTETHAHVHTGWERGDEARAYAAFVRESISQDSLLAMRAARGAYDASGLLAEVQAPTLVIHPSQYLELGVDFARIIASGIPDCELLPLETSSPNPLIDEVPAAVHRFLGGEDFSQQSEKPRSREFADLPSATAVILFADVVDSTAITERLGDASYRAKARDLGLSLRALVRECSGTPVEGPTLGDGVLAVFTSAREAIKAALRCAKAGDDAGLALHLGLHAGDVTREKDPDGRDNVYGGTVNIASRISGLSAPGEVLVSDIVRGLARTSAGVTFEDRGEQALKGVGEALRVWVVRGEG